MTTPRCHCDICLSELPIESFRRLKCGHCLCTTCIVGILKTRPVCPQCRAPVREKEPQPIYLTIVGTKPIALVVTEGIDQMDAETKLVSMRAAERKLRQVADEQKRVCGETVPELLRAIEEFKVRITPMFAKTRSQQTEIEALKQKLGEAEAMREQAERATALSGELAILRADQVTRVSELKDAYMKRDRERARADAADAQVLRAQRLEAEAQTEVRKLKGFLERGTEDIITLQKDKADLEQQVQDLMGELWELRNQAPARFEDRDLELE
ncbi:hypothetical protein B0H16DRAFT_1627976, partial [Mycena metata]